jgi:transposase InsO family protein
VLPDLDHLEQLLADCATYYNSWRPHSTLPGAVAHLICAGDRSGQRFQP